MSENSIILSAEQRDAFRLDAELKHHAASAAEQMIETGRCLCEIRDRNLFEYLGAKNLGEYAQSAVGFSERQAYNFIKIYTTYGEEGLKKFGTIGMSKLVELTTLNDTDREEMLESGKAAELSLRELKNEIKELKGENDQLRVQFDEITEGVKKQDAEIADKNSAIAELKKQLDEAQRPVVASMTDEEKAEMRKAVEKELKEKAKKEREKLDEQKKAAEESASEYKARAERSEEQLRMLSDTVKQMQAEIDRLQTPAAEQKPAPAVVPPDGTKDYIVRVLKIISGEWQTVLDTAKNLGAEELEKFKPKIIGIGQKLTAAAEEQL